MSSQSIGAAPLRRGSTVVNVGALTEPLAAAVITSDKAMAKLVPKNPEKPSASDDRDDDDDEADDDNCDEDTNDAEDVKSTKQLSTTQQLAILRGKLARRNKILEVVRRAYYHDVIVVKEELRHARQQQSYHQHAGTALLALSGNHASLGHSSRPLSSSRSSTSNAPPPLLGHAAPSSSFRHGLPEDRLSSVPSVDLRDVLPLFAPSETVLKVHPCETCGGHLELIHGESKELMAARQEMARATKSELQMKSVVHRLRTEAKEMGDVNDALQHRVKALGKENSYTLEQLQASRKMERDQKTLISSLRAKLQLAQTTQEDLDQLTNEYKDTKQQLVRSNHDRDIFSASNNHLKEELAEIRKTLHQTKVDKAQLESDYGAAYYKLQEELKKCTQLRDDLSQQRTALADKTRLSDELLVSLTAVKDELATATQRFAQTKRQLEDQLAEEEKAREDAQEQSLEFRKINKKIVRDLEQLQRDPLGLPPSSSSTGGSGGGGGGGGGGTTSSVGRGSNTPGDGGSTSTASAGGGDDMRNVVRKRIEATKLGLEHALMREHDLLGQQLRQKELATATATAIASTKPAPMRKELSRMPSTTIITRFAVPDSTPSPASGRSVTATDPSAGGADTRPGSAKSGWQGGGINGGSSARGGGGTSAQIAENDGQEGEEGHELDVKAFEEYHQQLHHLMLELEDGKDKSQQQQKVISDLERKNQTLLDRLEEAKLAIETLTGSVGALKARLNQDSAGAAEHLEDMMRQIEDGKRDQQYENERGLILLHFMRTISNYAYELCDNNTLLTEFDLDRPQIDDGGYDDSDSLLSPELLQRKRELRKKVLMDRAMKKFSQQCHHRAELVAVELKKLVDNVQRLRTDLDEAEHKIDSDELQLRTLDAEVSKLQLMVEVTKTNLARSDKALKLATVELEITLAQCASQTDEINLVRAQYDEIKDDTARLTAMLFDKTKSWEREMNANEKLTSRIATLELSMRETSEERDGLAAKLQEMEDVAQWKRDTSQHVGTMIAPDVAEIEIQTDRWRPQGLVLRQRNDLQRMPQRYLGKTAVTIACGPNLSVPRDDVDVNVDRNHYPVPSTAAMLSPIGAMPTNQSPRPMTAESPEPWAAEPDERVRDLLELDRELVAPRRGSGGGISSTSSGSRPSKTSHATVRPRNLSRLFLSSDGVSQKYIASPSRRGTGGGGDASVRPSTTL